ncbi:carbohydrate ABC transporter permease [Petrotoga sp. 9PW.55.5.1]|uniref:carbohydrate ABC transporter permease n=1 Tax=Petrotoga sp. 9PW.55.5.1 TaxID=1308979 RepID=UPI000DD65798|nr:sugar ABC transporter permease [Petrotoga sp. 9PW.55.5.1]
MKKDWVKNKFFNKLNIYQKSAIRGYIFLLPWLIGFVIFTAFPFFYSIYLSFSKVTITPNGIVTQWIGMSNYLDIFTKDVDFLPALTDSIIFVGLSTPLIIVASLLIALMLNNKFKGRAIFRAIYFLPVIIMSGPVLNELLFNKAINIIQPSQFALYDFFATLPFNLGWPILYLFDRIVLILWFSGVQILIFLAGIQKIDKALYEAAQIDGASSWVIFWKIILPEIRPLILVNAIYTIVDLATFPSNAINIQISNKMFQTGMVYSYSSAMSWVYSIIILVILSIAFLILRERKDVA